MGSVCLGAGLALSLLIPIDKHLLSTSYLLVTFGASSLALAALTPLDPFLDGRMPPLGALGRNPLLASILGGILTLALHAWVPAGIPSGATWAWSLSVLVLVTAAALVLDWRKIWIRL